MSKSNERSRTDKAGSTNGRARRNGRQTPAERPEAALPAEQPAVPPITAEDVAHLKEAFENPGVVPPPEEPIRVGDIRPREIQTADLSEFRGDASPSPVPEKPAPIDPWDPAFLGLSQDFAAAAKVKRKWDVIKVEKPTKSRVFRVHPSFAMTTVLLDDKDNNDVYMVHPDMRDFLEDEALCAKFALLACVSRPGTPFIWPIRLADPSGKWNIWHQTAWQIAQNARVRWTRMYASRDAGLYIADYDQKPLDQQRVPAWPDLSFRDWLELAFKGFTIDSPDHPVLKGLRMED
jgi:hypothetical protein